MGQKSQSESVVKIFQAFLRRRTWRQPELADEIGIKVHRLRQILSELEAEGVPLARDTESPTDVYWSVPKNWFPGGAFFSGEELKILLQELACMPKGKNRTRLMEAAASCLQGKRDLPERLRDIVVSPSSEDDERFLPIIMEAAGERIVLRVRYFSKSKGREGRRRLSIHKVLPGPPHRFIAFCHETDALKTFRADNLLAADLERAETFREVKAEKVERMIEGSVDGYFEEGEMMELRFLVRDPDARWVEHNLPKGMHIERAEDGIRVVVKTAAVAQVARFVVSLGGAATTETPVLARAVADLARAAIAQTNRALKTKPSPPGRGKRVKLDR